MLSWLAEKLLTLFGWKTQGQPPQVNKCVIIVAPHTSNWDFILFLLLKLKYRVEANFIGKHSLFVGPFGWFLRKIGGRPVNRNNTTNLVDAVVDAFNQNERFFFALSPEGTRSYKDHWKSGFYHIAREAQVPIMLCYLNTSNKTAGFGPLMQVSDDRESDISKIKAFYADKRGFKPHLFSDVSFRKRSNKTKQ